MTDLKGLLIRFWLDIFLFTFRLIRVAGKTLAGIVNTANRHEEPFFSDCSACAEEPASSAAGDPDRPFFLTTESSLALSLSDELNRVKSCPAGAKRVLGDRFLSFIRPGGDLWNINIFQPKS